MKPAFALARRAPLAVRLWRYQGERFPLARHAPFVLLLVASALGVAGGGAGPPATAALARAFASVVLGFLLLRVADEHKDAAKDARYRPERAVPRGLVSLGELRALGGAALLAQAVLATPGPSAARLSLLAWWTFFGMTWLEFGAPRWLERRPLAYAASHLPNVSLLYVHAMTFTGTEPRLAWVPAALAAYGAGATFEFCRKLRPVGGERPGVETYTAAWGHARAALAVFGAALLACGAAAGAIVAGPARPCVPALALLALACAVVGLLAWRMARDPSPRHVARLVTAGLATTLVVFAAMGPLAWLGRAS